MLHRDVVERLGWGKAGALELDGGLRQERSNVQDAVFPLVSAPCDLSVESGQLIEVKACRCGEEIPQPVLDSP